MNIILKLVVCPTAVIIVDLLYPNINFAAIYQPLLVGAVLGIIGHFMEVIMLRNQTFWLSLGADFVATTFIVYLFGLILPGARIDIFGAAIVGMFLGLTEYFVHSWLIDSGRNKKSPA